MKNLEDNVLLKQLCVEIVDKISKMDIEIDNLPLWDLDRVVRLSGKIDMCNDIRRRIEHLLNETVSEENLGL